MEVWLHFLGDYILQTEKMARMKVKDIWWAGLHATVYTLPFLVVTQSVLALLVIGVTHLLIDRYRLVKYLIFAKNKITDFSLRWDDCKECGFHYSTPDWLSVWILIIIDNFTHITINHLAIAYL